MVNIEWRPCKALSVSIKNNGVTKLSSFDGNLTLNETGSMIWELSNGIYTVREIAEYIAQKYNVVVSTELIDDVCAIIEQLEKKKLLIMNWDPIKKDCICKRGKEYRFSGEPCDVLLIAAPPALITGYASFKTQGMPPLGLAYISAALKQNHFTTKILDFNLDHINQDVLIRELRESTPKIVGISCSTDTFENAVRLATICKQTLPDVSTVVGGPHVTFEYEDAMNRGVFDFVSRNEGEQTLVELSELLINGRGNKNEIKGICYLDGDKVIINSDRPLIKDVDSLPFPDREALELDEYSLPGTVLASRGCPGRCVFCAASAMAGGKYRFRSASNVMEEINNLLDKGVEIIHFVDDTLTANMKRFRELLQLFAQSKRKFEWVCESRVDVVSKELLQEMKNAGCVLVQFGVESSSQKTLNAMHKGITVEQIVNAFTWAKEVGINTACCIIIGTPFDTNETIKENLDFGVRLQKLGARVVFSISTPYPGTEMYQKREELGLEIVAPSFNLYNTNTAVYNSSVLTAEEITNYYSLGVPYLLAHLEDEELTQYYATTSENAKQVMTNSFLWSK